MPPETHKDKERGQASIHSLAQPYLALFLLLTAATVATPWCAHVTSSPAIPVKTDLPPHVGTWTGKDIFYCQSLACGKAFDSRPDSGVCPACGADLRSSWSPAETRQLPADTLLAKKKYTDADGHELLVSVVVSGKELASIHRPQICLTAQGFIVQTETTAPITMPSGSPLLLRVLDLRNPASSTANRNSFYAYWFTDGIHQTPSHIARTGISAWDRIWNGKARRWTYVSIGGIAESSDKRIPPFAEEFIQNLYPLISTHPSDDL